MSDHIIKPGQIYESCYPVRSVPGDPRIRICVLDDPVGTPGMYGFGKVSVATLGEGHRPLRPRWIKVTQLHASATTRDGRERRTGYRLVEEADHG